MKTMKKLSLMAAASMCALSFTSCDNGDAYNPIVWQPVGTEIPVNPGTPTTQPTVVGEWLEDTNEGSVKLVGTVKYNEDNTYTAWTAIIDAPNSIYLDTEGTYTYSDNALTERYVSPITGSNTTDAYEVKALGKYSQTLFMAANASTVERSRIVATLNMNVGEEQTYAVDDADFTPTGYSSLLPIVASVDATGKITAVKRGTTFVKIASSIGTAVVRVVVTDPDNVIDDYFSLMGESIDKVSSLCGDAYIEIPGSTLQARQYALLDDMVSMVEVDYFSQKVTALTANLRDNVNVEDIQANFNARYTATSRHMWSAEKDGQKYKIFLDPESMTIVYMVDYTQPEPEPVISDADYEMFDQLINLTTADEAAAQLNYTIDEEEDIDEEDGEGLFSVVVRNNNVFRIVLVGFDGETRALKSVSLRGKKDISQEVIEPWYKAHYVATGNERKPYENEAGTYTIRFRSNSDGSVSVIYEKK